MAPPERHRVEGALEPTCSVFLWCVADVYPTHFFGFTCLSYHRFLWLRPSLPLSLTPFSRTKGTGTTLRGREVQVTVQRPQGPASRATDRLTQGGRGEAGLRDPGTRGARPGRSVSSVDFDNCALVRWASAGIVSPRVTRRHPGEGLGSGAGCLGVTGGESWDSPHPIPASTAVLDMRGKGMSCRYPFFLLVAGTPAGCTSACRNK